ncbi:3-dehydroquinate synthase [uncultured Desulfobacterium sp.]|uniref:3-dehydroquinate synthase n=1 Tax=uncultured Desulfobacterium sp. TaxID=201089 RepID=A0A445MRG5_9BACT|nr:3-dehydroquinate synthase [uncultured Desulfobacterium sp.]
MRTLDIKGVNGDSRILVGEKLERLGSYLPVQRPVVITDTTVEGLYGDKFPNCDLIKISTGEKIKNLDTVRYIYDQLVDHEADRSTFIVGIGGGIVCDIAGFVASTYMRGLRFGFVSSTLLAQVDASVGGKNGVNFHGYKNMIGTFNQPEFVICDMDLLKTLPKREVLCGLAEIAKHAFIGDASMCDYLERNFERALDLDEEAIGKLVYDSVVIKSGVVNMDEREKGERKKLNFGHTFGHAIEKTTDAFLHGEAISVGMVVASQLSVTKTLLLPSDFERIKELLVKLDLPTTLRADKDMMVDAIKKDKKRVGDDIDFVLLEGIGKAVIRKISVKELEEAVSDL